MNIDTHVKAVIRRHLDVKGHEVEASTHFVDDLGADSLDLADLTLALEEAFDIDIEDDHIPGLRTVQDAIDYVEARLAARPGGEDAEPSRRSDLP